MKNSKKFQELENKARVNVKVARLFSVPNNSNHSGLINIMIDKLDRTFNSNEDAISYLENLAYQTKGVIEKKDGVIEMTTLNSFYKMILIK